MSLMPLTAIAGVDMRNSHYQELKSRIHQDLLNRLNLDRLTRVKREDAEPEIRSLIAGMLDRERDKTPLSLYERESIVVQQRCLRAARDIPAGEVLERRDIEVLRPCPPEGIRPFDLQRLVGRSLRTAIVAGQHFVWTDVV